MFEEGRPQITPPQTLPHHPGALTPAGPLGAARCHPQPERGRQLCGRHSAGAHRAAAGQPLPASTGCTVGMGTGLPWQLVGDLAALAMLLLALTSLLMWNQAARPRRSRHHPAAAGRPGHRAGGPALAPLPTQNGILLPAAVTLPAPRNKGNRPPMGSQLATRRLDREHLRLIGCAQLPNANEESCASPASNAGSGGHPGRDDHPYPLQQPPSTPPCGTARPTSGRGPSSTSSAASQCRCSSCAGYFATCLAAGHPADGRTALPPPLLGLWLAWSLLYVLIPLQPARGGERGLPARHGRPVADAARGSAQRLVGGRHDPPLVPARPDGGGADPGALPAGPPAEAGPAAGALLYSLAPIGGSYGPAAAGGVGPADPQRPPSP